MDDPLLPHRFKVLTSAEGEWINHNIILKENKKKRKAMLKVDAGHIANMRGEAAPPMLPMLPPFFVFFTKKRNLSKRNYFLLKLIYIR